MIKVDNDCGEGWTALIDDMVAQMEAVIGPRDLSIYLKPKFGELRCHHRSTGLGDEIERKIRAIHEAAQARSIITCEVCGDPATPGPHEGRYATRCVRHRP